MLRTALRFAYRPNALGLCGAKEDIYGLLDTKWTPEEEHRVKEFIKNLKGLNAYVSSISPNLEEALKAYMIGWDMWKSVDTQMLKQNLRTIALPKKVAEIDRLPEGVPFTHNFHVLYFGAIAIDIPKVLSFADRCKVSLATITRDGAEYNQLQPGLKTRLAKATIESPFMEVAAGDRVFVHHGVVFAKASEQDVKLYKDNLEKVINVVKGDW